MEGQSTALQKIDSSKELGVTSALLERFLAEKTEEFRDAIDQAVKEIHPESRQKSTNRVVEVSIKSEELRAVLLRPGQEVEEMQATMCGLECCLNSGEGAMSDPKRKLPSFDLILNSIDSMSHTVSWCCNITACTDF